MFLTSVNSRREFLTNRIIPLFTTSGDEWDAPLINEFNAATPLRKIFPGHLLAPLRLPAN